MFYIYKIESLINHKVYIGITKNLHRRKIEHKCHLKNNYHRNFLLQNHYNKHVSNKSFEDVFEMSVIETTSTKKECCDREIYWIEYFVMNGYTVFNRTIGGDGIILNEQTEKERINKIRNNQKPIYAFSLNGQFIKKFRCIIEAGEYFNIEPSRISSSMRNGYRCNKYIFSRDMITFEEYASQVEVSVYVYSIDGEFIKKYKSITEVSRQMNLKLNAVSNALNRGIRYKNYLFYREKKIFDKYIPQQSGIVVYINVYQNDILIDTVKGLKECSDKYNIKYNTLNTYCRRNTIFNGLRFEKSYL